VADALSQQALPAAFFICGIISTIVQPLAWPRGLATERELSGTFSETSWNRSR